MSRETTKNWMARLKEIGVETPEPGATLSWRVREWLRCPSLEELQQWEEEGGCYTPCGCWVEPDGHCEHGVPSLMIILGYI